jgi:hypothetical protein
LYSPKEHDRLTAQDVEVGVSVIVATATPFISVFTSELPPVYTYIFADGISFNNNSLSTGTQESGNSHV